VKTHTDCVEINPLPTGSGSIQNFFQGEKMNKKFAFQVFALFVIAATVLSACAPAAKAEQSAAVGIAGSNNIVVINQSQQVVVQPPAAESRPDVNQGPAAAQPTNAPTVNTTACSEWNTAKGATNILHPGETARGDVEVGGVKLYDVNGNGQGTSVINSGNANISVVSPFGSGCETSTDVKFLVNKDLTDGCGSVCTTERVYVFTNAEIPTPTIYKALIP
jgi:hypothetical protein